MENQAFQATVDLGTATNPVSFRCFDGESDLSVIARLMRESKAADGEARLAGVADAEGLCSPSGNFDPSRDIVFALSGSNSCGCVPIGFSKLFWYAGFGGQQSFCQVSFLSRDGRNMGLWPAIIHENERRLRNMAGNVLRESGRHYQAWATESERDWIAALESEGYLAVRRFHNMRHRLASIPDCPMPPGLQLRAPRPQDFRLIWEAQKALNAGVFEGVADDWVEARYADWSDTAARDSMHWQVAWADGNVAGMVLAHVDADRNARDGRKLGFTEHIYVAPAWRRRGLASALVARALLALKAVGMDEAELGVDVLNESGAFALYTRLGYLTAGIDTWYRKEMPA